jgi:hypothetical protein
MKRLGLAVAIVAALSIVNPAVAGAGTVPGSDVYLVHGIGEVPGTNPVDVYARASGGTDFNLLLEGFAYADIVGDTVPAGDYDVLLCAASAAPAATIASCADNAQPAINGNFGSPVTVPADSTVAMFAGFGDLGRPEVLAFVLDVSCVEGADTGRATAAHAAAAGPVDILLAGTPVLENLANGESASLDVPAGDYEVDVTDGDVLDTTITLEIQAQHNNVSFVTGNPQQDLPYTVVDLRVPVELCEEPIETTTTTAPAPQQVTQPRLTG